MPRQRRKSDIADTPTKTTQMEEYAREHYAEFEKALKDAGFDCDDKKEFLKQMGSMFFWGDFLGPSFDANKQAQEQFENARPR